MQTQVIVIVMHYSEKSNLYNTAKNEIDMRMKLKIILKYKTK